MWRKSASTSDGESATTGCHWNIWEGGEKGVCRGIWILYEYDEDDDDDADDDDEYEYKYEHDCEHKLHNSENQHVNNHTESE